MNRLLSVLRLAQSFVLFALVSCGRLGEEERTINGSLGIFFSEGSELLTRSFINIPDTNDFILKVADSSGESIFQGSYGDCPEVLDVSPGSYVISVCSSEFSKPAFDYPIFGDEQCVVVKSGTYVPVKLVCTQLNSGVRLSISQDFRSLYSDAVLFLKSSSGSLMYSFAEKRTAYFMPGAVSLMMSRGAEDKLLMVKQLGPSDMLSLKVLAPEGPDGEGCSLSVSVDTSRIWIDAECTVGTYIEADRVDNALTVADARNAVGQDDVWVTGYIVGGDLTSSSASFSVPFKSMTNILIGPRSSTSDKASCMSVQLPDNEVREALNLVENPDVLGRRVCVRGDVVESYYGICGIKNTVEYVLY